MEEFFEMGIGYAMFCKDVGAAGAGLKGISVHNERLPFLELAVQRGLGMFGQGRGKISTRH